MSFQPGANLNTVAFGNRPENIELPHVDVRAPTTTDVNYPVGKWWLWTGNSLYYLLNQSSAGGQLSSNWIQIASGSGDILTITGTTNQITVTNSSGNVTLSIPSTFIAPGSIAATTTVTAGTGITATTGNIVASTGNITATAGAIGASTGLTTTTGNITATNGNLQLGHVGNKLLIAATSSATCSAGTFILGGTATTVVSNSAVTANSIIFLTTQALGTVSAASTLAVTAKSAGTSFTVTPSQSTDTSTIAYLIIN